MKEGKIGFVNSVPQIKNLSNKFYQSDKKDEKEVRFPVLQDLTHGLNKFLEGFLCLSSSKSDINEAIFGEKRQIPKMFSAEHIFEFFEHDYEHKKTDIVKFINKYNVLKSEISKFLYMITKDKAYGQQLVRSLTSLSATEAEKENEHLQGLFENENDYKKWLYDDKNGYFKVYKDYFEEEVEGKAKGVIDIVKFTPNLPHGISEIFRKTKV